MVSVITFSEAGGHPVNEDAFAVERHPADSECWLCFVADGQGGRAGGARLYHARRLLR
jgi:serine/threonine protein phosphatase PrpC